MLSTWSLPVSPDTLRQRLLAQAVPRNGHLVWTGALDRHGYGQIYSGIARTPISTHKAAWMVAHGRDVPPGKVVLPCEGDKLCIDGAHITLGTRTDVADRILKSKGKTRRPPRVRRVWVSPTTVLSDDEVREIRRLAAMGISGNELERRFPVSRSQISRIINRKSRADVR